MRSGALMAARQALGQYLVYAKNDLEDDTADG